MYEPQRQCSLDGRRLFDWSQCVCLRKISPEWILQPQFSCFFSIQMAIWSQTASLQLLFLCEKSSFLDWSWSSGNKHHQYFINHVLVQNSSHSALAAFITFITFFHVLVFKWNNGHTAVKEDFMVQKCRGKIYPEWAVGMCMIFRIDDQILNS